MLKGTNMKKKFGIQVTFMLKIKILKYILVNFEHFFSRYCLLFEPLLGWESTDVCHNLRIEKEGICSN